MGGLWSAWLFWFFEALVCVSGKTKCAKCVGKKFPFLCVGYFLFFSVSDCCLVRCRSVGSGSRPVIATNSILVHVTVLPVPLRKMVSTAAVFCITFFHISDTMFRGHPENMNFLDAKFPLTKPGEEIWYCLLLQKMIQPENVLATSEF